MTAEHVPLCRAGDSLPWPAVCKPMLPLPVTHLPSFKRFFPVGKARANILTGHMGKPRLRGAKGDACLQPAGG